MGYALLSNGLKVGLAARRVRDWLLHASLVTLVVGATFSVLFWDGDGHPLPGIRPVATLRGHSGSALAFRLDGLVLA